jgi:hypothetical protein
MDFLDSRTGSQSEFDANMAALIDYFNRTPVKTPAASKDKDDFANWNANLGWYAKNVDTSTTWDQARNFRKKFDQDNATSDAELKNVLQVQQTGITSEGMFNEPEHAKTSSGMYVTPPPDTEPPKTPLIPAEYKVYAAVAIVGSILIFSYGFAGAIPTAIAGWATGRKRAA